MLVQTENCPTNPHMALFHHSTVGTNEELCSVCFQRSFYSACACTLPSTSALLVCPVITLGLSWNLFPRVGLSQNSEVTLAIPWDYPGKILLSIPPETQYQSYTTNPHPTPLPALQCRVISGTTLRPPRAPCPPKHFRVSHNAAVIPAVPWMIVETHYPMGIYVYSG